MSDFKSSLISQLVLVADGFCVATRQSRASVAKLIFGRGGQIDDLEAGKRDLATGTFERAMAWFSGHWPDDAAWPEGIPRPSLPAEPGASSRSSAPIEDAA